MEKLIESIIVRWKASFANLDLKGFTWRRERVLYIALAMALSRIVSSILSGSVGVDEGIVAISTMIVGFFARGQVQPWDAEDPEKPIDIY